MSAQRCICGLSKAFPICDGSHRSEDWSCSVKPGERASYAFVAGPHHENLAERLAAERGGVAVHTREGPLQAKQLVAITDGTDLGFVKAMAERVEAPDKLALALGVSPQWLAKVFPQWSLRGVQAQGLALYDGVLAALAGPERAPPASPALSHAFISHAVADERLIVEPLDYLRKHYRADLFLCADSIDAGRVWHDEIVQQLSQRERFIMLLSRSANASTFCAFEVGYALALGKLPVLISLDGCRPPAYIQHLQMLDLPRRRAAKPWLDRSQALVSALLEVLAPAATRPGASSSGSAAGGT